MASHYGFSPSEILRMATLGNMEIVHRQDELGSVEPGKLADLVLLEENPLVDARHLLGVRQVYKGGRCLVAQPQQLPKTQSCPREMDHRCRGRVRCLDEPTVVEIR